MDHTVRDLLIFAAFHVAGALMGSILVLRHSKGLGAKIIVLIGWLIPVLGPIYLYSSYALDVIPGLPQGERPPEHPHYYHHGF